MSDQHQPEQQNPDIPRVPSSVSDVDMPDPTITVNNTESERNPQSDESEDEFYEIKSTKELVEETNDANEQAIQRVMKEIEEENLKEDQKLDPDPSGTEEVKDARIVELKKMNLSEREIALIRLVELKIEVAEWSDVREMTIAKLRAIAEYMDTVTKRTGIAKVISSGGGALAGGLTLIGGAMTLATAGAAAVPILLAGTGLGLTSGVTGGAAAISEKIIKSRQMAEAEDALKHDQEKSQHLQKAVTTVKKNEFVKRQIAQQLLRSSAGAGYNSAQLATLVTGTSTFGRIGAEAATKIFGDNVGKEVSKVLMSASASVISGSVTVMLGGVSMFYDIYRIKSELGEIAKLGTEGASELRVLADKLESSLREVCGEKNQSQLDMKSNCDEKSDENEDITDAKQPDNEINAQLSDDNQVESPRDQSN